MKHFWMIGCVAAVLVGVPAQAQLLGGGGLGGGGLGGGLGGNLGGSLGGTLGGTLERPARDIGSATERTRRSIDASGTANGTTRGEARARKQVDARNGRVAADGGGNASSSGGLTGNTGLLGRNLEGSGSAAGSGGANAGASADLIGTNQAGMMARDGIGQARNTVGMVSTAAGEGVGRARGVTGAATSRITSATGATGNIAGSVGGSGSGIANGMAGTATGNAMAGGSGEAGLTVLPGMPITDVRGRTLGFVQGVRSTADGAAQTVLVEVGNRMVEVPASQFSGNGEVLVTGMSRGELRSAGNDAPQAEGQN